jgi:hypothetical protein
MEIYRSYLCMVIFLCSTVILIFFYLSDEVIDMIFLCFCIMEFGGIYFLHGKIPILILIYKLYPYESIYRAEKKQIISLNNKLIL